MRTEEIRIYMVGQNKQEIELNMFGSTLQSYLTISKAGNQLEKPLRSPADQNEKRTED